MTKIGPKGAPMFDPKCYELAELFASDLPGAPLPEDEISELAQLIQTTIEEWLDQKEAQARDNSQFGVGA